MHVAIDNSMAGRAKRACALACMLLALVVPAKAGAGGFLAGPPLVQSVSWHTTTALADGRLLVFGSGSDRSSGTNVVQFYDPASGSWTRGTDFPDRRNLHVAVRLRDGRVLVAGGWYSSQDRRAAYAFDPATNLWSPSGTMNEQRIQATAALLPSGKVLVAGGYGTADAPLASAEVYDPQQNTWSPIAPMPSAHARATAVTLLDGRVLIVGGNGLDAIFNKSTADLFDEASGQWTPTGATGGRCGGRHAATLLLNGHVLVTGGEGVQCGSRPGLQGGCLGGADRYDPTTGAWSSLAAQPRFPRCGHTATRLPDGRVLLAGGAMDSTAASPPPRFPVPMAEIYDPEADSWLAGPLMIDRQEHTVSVVGGSILLVGGTFNFYSFPVNPAPSGTLDPRATTERFDGGRWAVQHRLRAAANLDDDIGADLLWHERATGRTELWLSLWNGQWQVSTLLANADWQLAFKGHFDRDTKTDLLWRNVATGEWALWRMDGATAVGGGTVFAHPDWRVTHLGDFDGDGKADLVWRNAVSGDTALWLMNGAQFVAGMGLLWDARWRVTHVADFDGDGRSDLLWRNDTTGETVTWLMDGARIATGATILADAAWSVTHVADLDADDKADLLWRNALTGETAAWLMDGRALRSGGGLVDDPNWRIALVGDFNGDLKHDLVWRNAATGHTAMWTMDGVHYLEGRALSDDARWSPVLALDLERDTEGRKDDLVWHHADTDVWVAWIMNGPALTEWVVLPTRPGFEPR